MNERIKELVKQADEWADNQEIFSCEWRDCMLQTFAELVVQDCIHVLQDSGMWNSRVSDVLYDHFGVPE